LPIADRASLAAACIAWLVACTSDPALAARATTVDGEAIEGDLVAVAPDGAVQLRVGTATRQVACADLFALELRAGKPAPSRDDTALVLRNGDLLRGTIEGGTGRAVTLRSPILGLADCSLHAIARIELPAPQPAQPLQPDHKLDKLLFRNSETVEGTVESLDAKGLKFRSPLLGALDIAFDRIAAVALASPDAAAPKPPEGIVAIVHTDDGSLVSGQLKRLGDGKLELQASFGPALALRLDRILRIEFRGGRLVFLSDLTPADAKETPFFDVLWHHRRDQSVDGNPLRLGERTYRKGLGVHSRCELTYALNGGFRRFHADLGIDEEVGDKGNADVTILVDGKPKFQRKALTGRDAPIQLSVDVVGASQLTLLVDFGGDFDICDHVDFADARLIR